MLRCYADGFYVQGLKVNCYNIFSLAAIRDHRVGQTNLGFGVRVENFGGVRCVLVLKTVGLFVFPALLGARACRITVLEVSTFNQSCALVYGGWDAVMRGQIPITWCWRPQSNISQKDCWKKQASGLWYTKMVPPLSHLNVSRPICGHLQTISCDSCLLYLCTW